MRNLWLPLGLRFIRTKETKSTIDFYYAPASPPCRTVLLTAAAVGIELNMKMTNLLKNEHLTPEFLKMNPQHTVPVLDDNGLYLTESRAIAGYLVDKYAKNDSLYPKDAQARALVNQKLFFDSETLYRAFAEYYIPIYFAGAPADPAKHKKIDTALNFFDKLLEEKKYAAGEALTIADFALVATVSSYELAKYDLSKYKNIQRWYETVKSEAPKYEETNGAGVKAMIKLFEILKKNSNNVKHSLFQ